MKTLILLLSILFYPCIVKADRLSIDVGATVIQMCQINDTCEDKFIVVVDEDGIVNF